MLVILFAVPSGLRTVIAGFLGARSYMPSSFWVYLCECASILLPTIFFLILYEFFKSNERSLPAFAKGLVCLLLIVPCINYVIQYSQRQAAVSVGYELKNLDGNTKKLLQNPQLKDDGYVFDSQKTYRLPALCH